MPFFSNLFDKIDGYTLNMTIAKDGENLNVMVYPQVSDKDEVQKEILPMSLKGTPQELDQQFFATLGAPLDKAKQLANQIKAFEKGLEKAATKASGKKEPPKEEDPKKEPEKKNEKLDFKNDEPVENIEKDATAEQKAKVGNEEPEEDVPDNVDASTGEIKEEKVKPVTAATIDDADGEKKEESVADDKTEENSETDNGSGSPVAKNDEYGDENW